MAGKRNDDNIYCSFCGKPQEMVGRLIAGNGVYICDACIDLCMSILEDGEPEPAKKGKELTAVKGNLLKPTEIKEILEMDPDGIFCDCIMTTSCYCPACIKKMNEHGKSPRPNQTAICQNIGGCFQIQGLNQSRMYLNTLKLNTSTRLNGMLNFLYCNVIPATSLPTSWLVSFLQRLAPLFHKEQCSQGDSFSFKHLFSLLD